MPCTDGGPVYENSQERIDELAAELCHVRKMFLQIAAKFPDRNKLTKEEWKFCQEQSRAQLQHRLHDKETALKEAKREHENLQNRIRQIQKLGGSAGDKLLTESAEAARKVKNIELSDPLTTELY